MFSRSKKVIYILGVLELIVGISVVNAQEATIETVNTDDLPINVARQEQPNATVSENKEKEALVSPSQAQAVKSETSENLQENVATDKAVVPSEEKKVEDAPAKEESQAESEESKTGDDFDFDLKMKSISTEPKPATQDNSKEPENDADKLSEMEVPQNVEYKANPIENLGNSVLSQMDSDLFSQMSEIEKSTTLLTLELRREKIRNEIEAQKAIRRRAADELEKQEYETKVRALEKKKELEALVFKEKQLAVDKEKVFELLRQRKLINAYMNQMLVMQQDWLKEKESLYAQLAEAEQEKQAIIASFKQKVDGVLEASAKNIQAAETAKSNFERIIKGLKARNEQLRKRIEADAQIIKNAKNSLYLKSQSIEELKDKNAAMLKAVNAAANDSGSGKDSLENAVEDEVEQEEPYRLSSQYAILEITGKNGIMSAEVIDADGQSTSIKVGSALPTGHIVKEIGSDYIKFGRDGQDDFLYVGKTIDGYIPTLGLIKNASDK